MLFFNRQHGGDFVPWLGIRYGSLCWAFRSTIGFFVAMLLTRESYNYNFFLSTTVLLILNCSQIPISIRFNLCVDGICRSLAHIVCVLLSAPANSVLLPRSPSPSPSTRRVDTAALITIFSGIDYEVELWSLVLTEACLVCPLSYSLFFLNSSIFCLCLFLQVTDCLPSSHYSLINQEKLSRFNP